MLKSIQDIEGIGPENTGLLNQEGIYTSRKLLEIGSKPDGRKKLAERTSISEYNILKWVHMCDLCRIIGIAGQFAELLEESGVETINELQNKNAENLAKKLFETNENKRLCKATPSVTMIQDWVNQANSLVPMVLY